MEGETLGKKGMMKDRDGQEAEEVEEKEQLKDGGRNCGLVKEEEKSWCLEEKVVGDGE